MNEIRHHHSRAHHQVRTTYPRLPVVGVSAIVRSRGEILLVKRGANPGKGKWSAPGGIVNIGEKIRDALRREILEECGIEIRIGQLLDIAEIVIGDRTSRIEFHYVIIYFQASALSRSVRAGDDAADAKWVDAREAFKLDLTRTFRSFLRKHLEELNSA